MDRVLQLLMEVGDGQTVPILRFFENVVDVLGTKYPGMFAQDPITIVNGVKAGVYIGTYIPVPAPIFENTPCFDGE